ncbi:MAG: hypothetical protein M3509_13705 [Chloroflexota bacterium]|nr:hypothetical protein [Chloroflexota bacterium]
MSRLKILLNLVILVIGAAIAWHEYHHPPEAKPKREPEAKPKPEPEPESAPQPKPSHQEQDAPSTGRAAPAVPPAAPAANAALTEAPAVAGRRAEADRAKADRAAEPAPAGAENKEPHEPSVPDNAVRGDGSGDCPEDYPIKGNASSRIYHVPDTQSYQRTIPEFCFPTTEAAEAAGFRAPRN